MSEFFLNPKIILAALLIIISVVTDLRTKKVPNRLIIIGFILAIALIAIVDGKGGVWPALASLGAAALFAFPLYSLKAIAAGDLKLIIILSLLLNWNISITMILASMIWGSILGLVRVVLAGKSREFFQNIVAIVKKATPATQSLNYVPYTIAILFGFLTSLGLSSVGISWI